MNKYILFTLLIFLAQIASAQVESFIGTIPTVANSSRFEKITTYQDNYYFGASSFDEENRNISIFHTNKNFEVLNSLEDLKINDVKSTFICYLEVYNDRLMILSSARVNGINRLYSHSFSLDLKNHTIIDSLNLEAGQEFYANEFKTLSDSGNKYTIGNILADNSRETLSANYVEFTKDGHFVRFEELKFDNIYNSESLFNITFDYNPNTKQYFLGDLFVTHLFDSNFNQLAIYPVAIPIQIGSSFFLNAITSSCNFTSNNTVECISAGRQAGEYTNFLAEYRIEEDSIVYSNAIPLHSNENEEERSWVVRVSRDIDDNYYFSYQGAFSLLDGIAIPNKIYISKFDKNFNEIFFLELENENEYVINETKLDNENNLIVVGGTTTPESQPLSQNFYIKVSESGELLTSSLSVPTNNIIEIYPNPSDNMIFIEGLDESTNAEFSIFTLDGKLLQKGKLAITAKPSISIAQLSTGMYIVNIVDKNKTTIKKIIKK